jgi:hypothetical protein
MTKKLSVFISYSRSDESIVTPIVNIIRAVGVGTFQDIDDIPFGKRWRPIIENSIKKAKFFLIFWSTHSANSKEVQRELKQAINLDKSLIPVIMDSTPFPSELKEFQYIELKNIFKSTHGLFPYSMNGSVHYPNMDENSIKKAALSILNFLE